MTPSLPEPPDPDASASPAVVAHLIRSVLSDLPRYDDGRYLDWLYHANPRGRAIERSVVGDDGALRAHLAAVPQSYRDADTSYRFVQGVNGVTATSKQRRGLFTRMGLDIFAEAEAGGTQAWLGLPNFVSTPAVCQHLGAELLGPLPVRLALPRPGWGRVPVDSRPVTAEVLASDAFADLAGRFDEVPAERLVQEWPLEVVRWRLAMPTGDYVLHHGGGVVAVTTRVRALSRWMALLLKVWPVGGSTDRPRMGPVLAAVCRHHRVPAVVYAGFNRHVGVAGVPIPVRFRPAPLNLTLRRLAPGLPTGAVRFDTFEFLDFDVL